MSSDKQIKANRLNAQHSTGPDTAEGKARVALNAVKHGLTARQVVLPSEDPEEFGSYRAALLSSLNPQGGLEEALAEKIIVDGWRLRRIPTMEAALFQRGHHELAERLNSAHKAAVNRSEVLNMITMTSSEQDAYQENLKRKEAARAHHAPSFYITQVLENFSGELSNLSRYESALIRSWFRTIYELERLQARRAGEQVPAPSVVDVNVHLSEALNPSDQRR